MENFGNYIFLIFIILIFILNTLLAARKKKAAQAQASNNAGEDNNYPENLTEQEEWEKWFSDGSEEEEEETTTTSFPQESKLKHIDHYQPLYFQPEKKSTKKNIPSTSGNDNEEQTNKIRLTSAEEARRAFIYSEIFNRKY